MVVARMAHYGAQIFSWLHPSIIHHVAVRFCYHLRAGRMQLKDKARELIDGKNKAVTAARQFKAEVEKVSAALTEAEATTAAAQKVRTYPVHCANAGVRIHHLPACFCFFFA